MKPTTTFIADYYPADVAGVTALEYCFHPVGDMSRPARASRYCIALMLKTAR